MGTVGLSSLIAFSTASEIIIINIYVYLDLHTYTVRTILTFDKYLQGLIVRRSAVRMIWNNGCQVLQNKNRLSLIFN